MTEKLQRENFELRAEINKLRVENKIIRTALEKAQEEVETARQMIVDLQPMINEAMNAAKALKELCKPQIEEV